MKEVIKFRFANVDNISMNAVGEHPSPATVSSAPERHLVIEAPSGPGFPSTKLGLYISFWLLAVLLVPTCAFLYALPLAPVIWIGAKVGGTATISHGGTLGLIVLATSFALALVTIGLLWKRTREIARDLP